ncbi:ANTAR domain-containing protein [Rhodoferax sp.]|uniref:ANTAR domain-containing protein n=1 Tax=Rhodoferax sp. TaxID=50421 RepID=UPI0025EC8AFC|nr:ANTAR domain-containing protein [Rhodoferax sp.]MCM2341055.1 ANTAR domain-containing protein [Rhodoferax sp.]
MTSALIHVHGSKGALPLVADLEAAGIQVLGIAGDRNKLVQDVVRHAPDLVICDEVHPGDALFKAILAIAETAPCAVLLFTNDADAGLMVRAIESGVHAYVVNGYGAHRLRSLIHLAQVRFRHEAAQRRALQELATRFDERKLVDRAKGILMRTQQVSDDDAFQFLRTTSMHTNQRLGQVSQHIIHSAKFAEDVNRCGQLRMLSQRLVKLYALPLAGAQAAQCVGLSQESVQRMNAHLAHLGKSLSQATYGDLLGQLVPTWARLKRVLQGSGAVDQSAAALVSMDELAEQLLQGAERLTTQLESAGLAPPLRVLNMAGRQRMLSQRFAKYAVLSMLGDTMLLQRSEAGMAESRAAFEQALTYLNSLPLSTPEIQAALQAAGIGWLEMLTLVKGGTGTPERAERAQKLALASENLLDVFERLSTHYERSMQMLVGS